MPSRKQHTADLFIVLILFFVYTGSALMLGVLGANSYSRTVAVLQEGYNERSGMLYIAQKVQQNDIGGGIRLDTYQGNDALVLVAQDASFGFETWIFIRDGYLCELQNQVGRELSIAQAQKIMPMKTLRLSISADNLLSVSVTTDTNVTREMCLALISRGETFNTGTTPSTSPSTVEPGGSTVMTPPASEVLAGQTEGSAS